MIQLANDPAASRAGASTADERAKAEAAGMRRSRTGHAWPFISRSPAHAGRQDKPHKPVAADSGS